MSATFTDRELLYGILAAQMGLVAREALVEGIKARTAGMDGHLGEILLQQGAFSVDTKQLVDALVEQHLELHDNDSARSLASLSTVGSLGDDLKTLGVPALNAGLEHLTVAPTTTPSDSTHAKPTGKSLSEDGRFRVLRMHAKGGIGQVSLAVDDQLSREVALKELQPRYADDPGSRHRFVLEAEVTGGLEHPGVVPVYGAGQYADGRPFYAMRFIRGDSLQDASAEFHRTMAKDPQQVGYELELRKLLRRFIDVCEAMEYAHSRGVLHRDLKPGNIMLGRYGETLVVDWGLAKLARGQAESEQSSAEAALQPASADDSAATRMGSTIGTPNYMSPEQAAGEIDKLGAASDVYSLGATLYHVLTGQPPFQGEDVGVILAAVQSGSFARPREINPSAAKSLEAICLKAMSLAPEHRYPSALSLAEDVERHLADEPVLAKPDSPCQSLQRWARRHRGATTAGAAALLLVALISGIAFLAVRGERDEANRQRDRAVESEQIAQENFDAAENARALAEEQRELAGRIAYNSTLSEASVLVGSDPMMARSLLEDELRCPTTRRDFLWHLLHNQVVREEMTIPLEYPNTYIVAYSDLGDVLAVSGLSKMVVLFDPRSGEITQELETNLDSIAELHFSPDGKNLAAVEFDSEEVTDGSSSESIMSVEVWDLAKGECVLTREHTSLYSSTFWFNESSFSANTVISESEYSNQNPNYRPETYMTASETGEVISRWYQWTWYDVLTDSERVKFFRIGEGTRVLGNAQVLPPLIALQCENDSGQFIWSYNFETKQVETMRLETAADEVWAYPFYRNAERAKFLFMGIMKDVYKDLDDWLDIDTIPFEALISLGEVAFDGSDEGKQLQLGKLQTGAFIDSRRFQFRASDQQGTTLAMLLDRRPLIQLLDLSRPDRIHQIPAHRGDVVSVAMSPDATQLASMGLDQKLRLWDVEKLSSERQDLVASIQQPERLLLAPEEDEVWVLGRKNAPMVLDPNTGNQIPDPSVYNDPNYREPYCEIEKIRISDVMSLGTLAFTTPEYRMYVETVGPDGKKAKSYEGNFMSDFFRSHPLASIHTELTVSQDGKQLVIADGERLVGLDLEAEESDELWGPYYPDFQRRVNLTYSSVSDDLRLFATLEREKKKVRIYDFESKELLWELPEIKEEPFQIGFLPDSHRLAVFSEKDGPTRLKNIIHLETWDVDLKESAELSIPGLDSEFAQFWHDGRRVLVHSQFVRRLRIVDASDGEVVIDLDLGRDTPLGMFPESDLLMLGKEDGSLMFWDVVLGQYRADLQVFENEPISEVVLSRDKNTLIVLGEEGSLSFLGADKLRDDLADVRSLMLRPVEIEPVESEAEKGEAQGLSDDDLPQIEIVDELPEFFPAGGPPAETDSFPAAPLPPAPFEGPPEPPAPAPIYEDSDAPMPPAPIVDPSA